MSVSIELLGTPRVTIDGKVAEPPRGRKAWALLAFLLLTPRPPPRERVATLLFDGASDPLGALRWNLTQLRRVVGSDVEVGGEPLTVTLPSNATVDTEVLAHGDPGQATTVTGLGRDLLEGIDLEGSPAFDTWLLAERRRFAGIAASVLREAATARLAAGEAGGAIDLAARLVTIEDFDEEAHALLVRAYVASGDIERARQQSATSAAYLRDELGIEPSATLARALDDSDGSHNGDLTQAGSQSERAVEALVEAGRTAVNAGAVEAGLQTLRHAADQAGAMGSSSLTASAQLAYGIALVHIGRGRDGEGATVLHAALASATDAGDQSVACEAARELGYVEFLRARYDRAETWLQRAMQDAPSDIERASAEAVLGAVKSDLGHTEAAVSDLANAAESGRAADKPRLEGWARAMLGRCHLLRSELPEAVRELERTLELCHSIGWVSFTPFSQTLRGDVSLVRGEVDEAATVFEAAFALGCQIGDPCWEGLGARGIGLVKIERGDVDGGFEWLVDAAARCVRVADAYLWIEAYCLDALCTMGLRHGRADVAAWASRLEELAARTGMREMLVRSHLHRAALGMDGAARAARLFAREIDNPTLQLESMLTT